MEKSAMQKAFEEMKKSWPAAVVARTEVKKFTGGAISEKRLANLDSQGLGPSGRFRLGKKICYPVDTLILWLEGRAEAIN
jgi:hypothetical protein